MFKNAKLFRFMPDQAGKGGVKTGYTSHRQINDTYDVLNFHVFVDRWRRDSASKAVSGVTNYTYSVRPMALHAYSAYSLSDPTAAPATKILSHGINAGPTYVLRDHSSGAAITYPSSHSGNAVAGAFITIKNRCFVCSGDGEGTILTQRNWVGTTVPTTSVAFNYDIGATGPTAQMPYYLNTTSATTTVYMYNGSWYINAPVTSTALGSLGAGTPLTISDNFNGGPGGPWDTTLQYAGRYVEAAWDVSLMERSWGATAVFNWTVGNTYIERTDGLGWDEIGIPFGANGRYSGLSLFYSNDGGATWNNERITEFTDSGFVPGTLTRCNLAGAVANSTGMGGVPWTDIYIAGYSGLSEFTANTGTLGGLNYGTFTMTYETGTGPLSWGDIGPTYAYAWYDPVSGHVSNVGPLTVVTDKDQVNQEVNLQVGTTEITYPTGNDAIRFPYILLFRTISTGGSTPFVIGSLDPLSADWFGLTVPRYARGLITFPAKASLIDGETFTLNDGVNPATIFEFDTNGAVTPGNIAVDISVAVTAIQVAAAATAAINGVGAGLAITATDHLNGQVTLANDAIGAYNNAIVDTVATPLFLTVGMSGGAAGLGATAVVVDDKPDSKLLINGALRAPLFTNGKPVVSYWNGTTAVTETAKPAHMEYWDQRLWLSPTQDPASILYSCDPVQCTFGVAEESFPATNVLRIPAEDGAVTGMRLIGPMLVVFTKRYAYYVAGSNETNYRLMRYSTHMSGVGRYQTAEVPGEAEGQAVLAFFGTDGRVGLYSPGSKIQYISDPIQKTIDEQLVFNPDYSQWRLHYTSIRRRRYLILADPGVIAPVSNRGMMFTFDLDRGIWTRQQTSDGVDSNNSAYAFASIFGGYSGATTGEPQEEILYTSNTIQTIRAWLYDTSTSLNNGLIKTFALDGGDPKKLKILNFVRLYVSQATGSPATPWLVYVYPNETQRVDISCIENPDDVYNLYKPTGYIPPLDGTNAKELIALPTDKFRNTTAFGVGANVAAALVGYRFVIAINGPQDATAADLFAFDVCMSDYQDPQVVNP